MGKRIETQTAQSLYDEIKDYIVKQNISDYAGWYCGIASDWEQRLFSDHNVESGVTSFIVGKCLNDSYARKVEKALLKLGCSGGQGGGDHTTVYVYAYLMTLSTKQWFLVLNK